MNPGSSLSRSLAVGKRHVFISGRRRKGYQLEKIPHSLTFITETNSQPCTVGAGSSLISIIGIWTKALKMGRVPLVDSHSPGMRTFFFAVSQRVLPIDIHRLQVSLVTAMGLVVVAKHTARDPHMDRHQRMTKPRPIASRPCP